MTAINHITILVSDIEKSKRFYRDVLGLETTFERSLSGEQFSRVMGEEDIFIKFAALRSPAPGIILELVQFIRPEKELYNNDFRHIAFEVENVDAVYKSLREKGVETVSEPVTITGFHPKVDGKRFFYFRDPDKNLVELFNKRENLYSS